MQASQLPEGLEGGAISRADSGTLDDMLPKVSQQLECSSEEPAQTLAGSSDERSNYWVRAECLYCFGSRMHLWFSSIKYQVSSYYMFPRYLNDPTGI